MPNRVKVKIYNREYLLDTDESEEYTKKLAKKLNDRLGKFTVGSTLSLVDASVLVALDCLDEAFKANENVDNIRAQVKDYVDDAGEARLKLDETQRELRSLRAKNANLERELSMKTSQLDAKDKELELKNRMLESAKHAYTSAVSATTPRTAQTTPTAPRTAPTAPTTAPRTAPTTPTAQPKPTIPTATAQPAPPQPTTPQTSQNVYTPRFATAQPTQPSAPATAPTTTAPTQAQQSTSGSMPTIDSQRVPYSELKKYK